MHPDCRHPFAFRIISRFQTKTARVEQARCRLRLLGFGCIFDEPFGAVFCDFIAGYFFGTI